MERLRLWATIAGVVLVGAVVGYFGYGRWWGKARASDIREAILRQLDAKPAYVQFQKEMSRIYVARPAIDIWLSVPELPVERTGWDKLALPAEWSKWERSKWDSGADTTTVFGKILHGLQEWLENPGDARNSYQKTVSRLDHAAGRVPDGRYRVSLVARTGLSTALLEKPVKLAEYIGEAELAIHSGKLRTISVSLLDLPRISSLHSDIVSILRSTQRGQMDAIYPGTRLQLLDATACSFRNAAHLRHLFEDSADSLAQRLLHATFLTGLRSATHYHHGDHFTVASAGRLRIPEALTFGEGQSHRACVLATRMNTFGEPVDASQAIVALEQTGNTGTTVREVARVEAIEFDARFVNKLLVGDPTLSEQGGLGTFLLVANFTILGLFILLALVIFNQLDVLFNRAHLNVTIKNKNADKLPSKAEADQK